MTNNATIRTLSSGDSESMRRMLILFAAAFEDDDSYLAHQPDDTYLEDLLCRDTFIAVVASTGAKVVGGLAGYLLPKFEQQRSELYIYDLAVDVNYRRQGVATALIAEVQRIALLRGAYVIFVQADRGDTAAINLYTKLGLREDVHHFDIPPR